MPDESSPPRTGVALTSIDKAIAIVDEGMTIGIGGLQGMFPMALIRALMRSQTGLLNIVGPPVGMASDPLIAAGLVSSVASPYMGAGSVVPIAPAFRQRAESGELSVWECDEGILLCALRAAGVGLPYLPWRGAVGTSIPRLNDDIEQYIDARSGETLLRVPAQNLDVALLHAQEADELGNVRYYRQSVFADVALARAADKVIVQVERLVPRDIVTRSPEQTALHQVDAVVVAPWGAHPFRCPGHYIQDDDALRAYASSVGDQVRAGRDPSTAGVISRWMAQGSHEDYLLDVGIERLLELSER